MTLPATIATEALTCEEIHTGFDGLIARIAELALERDDARTAEANALEAACAMRQELTRARHQVHVADVVNAALRTELDQVRTELRCTHKACRELAVTKGVLEMQNERLQHELDRGPACEQQHEQPRKQRRWRLWRRTTRT